MVSSFCLRLQTELPDQRGKLGGFSALQPYCFVIVAPYSNPLGSLRPRTACRRTQRDESTLSCVPALLRALVHLLLHLVDLLARSVLGLLAFLDFLCLDGGAGRSRGGGFNAAAGKRGHA